MNETKCQNRINMGTFNIIKQKGKYFSGDSLHYLIGVDEHGNFVCEVDGEESYCSSCIKGIVKERNAELNNIGYKSFYEIHDCSSDTPFAKISFACEITPERDDFESCDNCGAEINVGVLFTFPDEIKRWIDEDIAIDEISDSDAYRIYTCITSEGAISKYPKLVNQLRDKLETTRV